MGFISFTKIRQRSTRQLDHIKCSKDEKETTLIKEEIKRKKPSHASNYNYKIIIITICPLDLQRDFNNNRIAASVFWIQFMSINCHYFLK